jgi:hypothetical protein
MLNNKKEITIMKRTYIKPTTKVVPIQQRQQLLSGSPYDNIQSPVETYDSEGDDINDIQGIW